MTMETWENLYRKTNIVEVEEKWVLCPGKVIFEHPTELTNTFMAVSRVQWDKVQGTDRLENSFNNMTGNVSVT